MSTHKPSPTPVPTPPTPEDLIRENQRLLAENNTLLKELRRTMLWSFWLRLAWYFVLLGLPFIVYYYLIEPYFNTFGSSFEVFEAGLQEIPGWKQYYKVD